MNEVTQKFVYAITAFILGGATGYITPESVDQLRSDLEAKFSQVPCDTARDVIVIEDSSALVDIAVRDSLGDSIGVTQEMRVVRPRVVANIQQKYNPGIVTQDGDIIYSVIWCKRGDSVLALRYGAYYPVGNRLWVQYITTAER